MAGLHEFLLHHVLDFLDVDEGLRRGADALRDGARDGDGGRGVALHGEEGLADGDLDLLLAPRDDLVVAADDAQGRRGGGVAIDGDLAGAVEEEALRDEVGVVVDEGFLDQLVQLVQREADGRLGMGKPGEVGGDLAADARDPGAVAVVEDVPLALGEVDVGQRLAECVGDLGEDEALLAVRAGRMTLGSSIDSPARTSRQA